MDLASELRRWADEIDGEFGAASPVGIWLRGTAAAEVERLEAELARERERVAAMKEAFERIYEDATECLVAIDEASRVATTLDDLCRAARLAWLRACPPCNPDAPTFDAMDEGYKAGMRAMVAAVAGVPVRCEAKAIVMPRGEPGPKRLERFARVEDAREYARANGGEVIRISGDGWHGEDGT